MPEVAMLVADEFDNLFKQIITAGWNVKSDGEVDSPTGFFALVEIPSHAGELNEMAEALELDVTDGGLLQRTTPGWYITCENSDGIIWAFKCPTKDFAENTYETTLTAYEHWLNGEPA